ncbi:hypothetical protein [Caballeronia sp. INDeC2]|uniref:hypothetical protein n=1 Tax=Caballeronia sp. INDeC2 TaxID=2921747 RepID=UPI0020289861|nr:hypothetical protein [Caballeronia sp. INDeC2]
MAYELKLVPQGEVVCVQFLEILRAQYKAARSAALESRVLAERKQEPAGWQHSKTLCLYETEEEVPLADGDEWAVPLFTHPAPDDASQSDRKHWNPVYNTDPMQRACGDLPEGWQIEIGLERNAGWVDLRSPEGALVTFDDDADKFDWKIHKAIDRARQSGEEGNE